MALRRQRSGRRGAVPIEQRGKECVAERRPQPLDCHHTHVSADLKRQMPKCSEFHVHLPRHSLDSVSWKGRKPVAAALKDIYRAVDAAAGEAALTALRGVLLGPEMPGDRPELGVAPGARSSRSMLFPPTSAAFCTPRTPSRRSIPSGAGQFRPGDITPAARQRLNSSSWS